MSGGGPDPVRIAMWSGPRNLSTAMMRSFGNRADCAVIDEPFYAAFLALSGTEHPMRDAIVDDHETDWRKVAATLAGPAPDGKHVFYQKHMTHHMLPQIGREWMRSCRHAFLIRHPVRVLASYSEKREMVDFEALGLRQQDELYGRAAEIAGTEPPVVDADALLAAPERVLSRLCEAIGITFDAAMLSWPRGRRATDGIWAAHWYDAVMNSTGFGPARPMPELSDPKLADLAEQALPIYQRLAASAVQ